jgi:ABC-type sugar transport system ATPase subunit
VLARLQAAHLPVDAPVEQLKLGDRQLVALAHALIRRSRVLILDEPTAALDRTETAALFDVLRRLQAEGVTILYVSHRLPEIFELCDVVTVLRDGQHVRTSPIGSITPGDLIGDMLGSRPAGIFPRAIRHWARSSYPQKA